MERRTQKRKPGPSRENLTKMWGIVIYSRMCHRLSGHRHPLEFMCLSPSSAMGTHWNLYVSVILCLDSLAAFCLSQAWISSPCAWNTLSPYSLASAVLLGRNPTIFESAHTGNVCIKLVLYKTGNGLCYVFLATYCKQMLFDFLVCFFFFFTNLAKVTKHFFLGVLLLLASAPKLGGSGGGAGLLTMLQRWLEVLTIR